MDDYDDDYPILDFELSDGLGAGDIYAADQIVWGPDGPEIGPIDSPWDTGDVSDDGYDDEFFSQPQNDQSEEFYVLEPKDLSCCYEEWEDYC